MFLRPTTYKRVTAVLLGALAGDLVGELIRRLIPSGTVKDVVLYPVSFGFSPFTLDLVIFKITLGLTISFNLVALLFVFLMVFLLWKF